MKEREWHNCTDLPKMLDFLRGRVSNRKLRLFACACYRQIWALQPEGGLLQRWQVGVEMSERYADKLLARKEPEKARLGARDAPIRAAATSRFFHDMDLAARETAASWTSRDGLEQRYAAEAMGCQAQANLLRDIAGNPFRPSPAIDTHWLSWNDAVVKRLAEAAYEDRELPSGHLTPSRLAILADALEEAGCNDSGILTHLRSPGPHVWGCFVVDLLLGKS